jgi:hypothetical protein
VDARSDPCRFRRLPASSHRSFELVVDGRILILLANNALRRG